MIDRRSLLRAMLAAPAIVAASRIMPVRTPRIARWYYPMAYGYLKNVDPVEVQPGVFQLHNGAIEAVQAVYESGELLDPARYRVDLAEGRVVCHAATGPLLVDLTGDMSPPSIAFEATGYGYPELPYGDPPPTVQIATTTGHVMGLYVRSPRKTHVMLPVWG